LVHSWLGSLVAWFTRVQGSGLVSRVAAPVATEKPLP
jgi:hypothetical protein